MTDAFIVVLILGLANGVLVEIVTASTLVEPLRKWAARRSEWVGEWMSCPLCLGTWTATGIAICAAWRLTDWSGVDAVLGAIAAAGAIHMTGLLALAARRALMELSE